MMREKTKVATRDGGAPVAKPGMVALRRRNRGWIKGWAKPLLTTGGQEWMIYKSPPGMVALHQQKVWSPQIKDSIDNSRDYGLKF
ncbi:MAG: hypothetical protein WAM60_13070 [Candidatus Promineifilaceae bacterium]